MLLAGHLLANRITVLRKRHQTAEPACLSNVRFHHSYETFIDAHSVGIKEVFYAHTDT
jgi:hypothetical protein